jgi:hypothetical protein
MKTPFHWIACAIVLMLTAVLPAHAEMFGNTTVGAQPSGALSPNYKRVSKFVLSENAVLDSVYAHLDGAGGPQTGTQPVSAVIYADDNGVPGAKVFQSITWNLSPNSTASWYYFAAYFQPLPAGNYWLGLHTGGTVGIIRNYGDGSSATNWYGNADPFADEATGRFGPGSPGTGSLSIYAVYYPAAQLSIAGRATIAATPSGGMSANFKRGSRFTMTERGRVPWLSAYLDSLGGGTSPQTVRLALYRDAAGVPGERLGMTEEITLAPGSQGQWRTAPSAFGQPQATLDPGNYWIVVHSSGTAGVIRNYGDGAANWYGNADTYSDGPSSPFGAGNTGTVTISAAAIYVPSDVASAKFGRTSVATIPSGGLSANFIRGSGFGAYKLLNGGTITALWAYLDGLGGASGSQQVRMALYQDDLYHGDPGYKLVESDIVTIAAGRPPGWVRFPISTPAEIYQAPSYWIAIQSGNTAGVVRNYGDGPANWAGQPGTFSSGAPGSFPDRAAGATSGTVTLSVYVEYARHDD